MLSGGKHPKLKLHHICVPLLPSGKCPKLQKAGFCQSPMCMVRCAAHPRPKTSLLTMWSTLGCSELCQRYGLKRLLHKNNGITQINTWRLGLQQKKFSFPEKKTLLQQMNKWCDDWSLNYGETSKVTVTLHRSLSRKLTSQDTQRETCLFVKGAQRLLRKTLEAFWKHFVIMGCGLSSIPESLSGGGVTDAVTSITQV